MNKTSKFRTRKIKTKYGDGDSDYEYEAYEEEIEEEDDADDGEGGDEGGGNDGGCDDAGGDAPLEWHGHDAVHDEDDEEEVPYHSIYIHLQSCCLCL